MYKAIGIWGTNTNTHTQKEKMGVGKADHKGGWGKNKGTSILFVSILAELASKTPGHDHMVINK